METTVITFDITMKNTITHIVNCQSKRSYNMMRWAVYWGFFN